MSYNWESFYVIGRDKEKDKRSHVHCIANLWQRQLYSQTFSLQQQSNTVIMGLKDIKDFTADEVGLWLAAQGIDSSKAIEEKVDGDLLLSLSADDFKSDLGLSGLQSKKVMKNIEFSKVRVVLFMIILYSPTHVHNHHILFSYLMYNVHILCSYLMFISFVLNLISSLSYHM